MNQNGVKRSCRTPKRERLADNEYKYLDRHILGGLFISSVFGTQDFFSIIKRYKKPQTVKLFTELQNYQLIVDHT